ncbi:elongation factor P [Nitzschia inconspicua]|uniref:Elongation factor P n=1 Tax=Nitzschia inconspicua TaxID=303405 RepID=A0A9K3K6N8_9STRA|nr:elongation factor P [Nitzschia inconspicua]KAG7352936.1 elongation factor P [Nitzschia inconspicua]
MMLKFISVMSMLGLVAGFCPMPSVGGQFSAMICRPTTSLGVAVDTSDIKNGMTLELDGEPYKVLSFSIMKQARGAAKTTIKFKNLMRGNTIENTYRSGEKFETALIEKNDHQFTYEDGNTFFFMNSETFEEVPVDAKVVGDKKDWIEEGKEVSLVFFKGKTIEVVVPSTEVYQIVETEPNVKGNTAQGYTKPAVLSCGATISVPGYLEQGEMIKVDTEKGVFLERANK